MRRMYRRARTERGSALLEAALMIPLMLLVSVAVFEFGRAFETWQIMTNAAREGARVAVMPNSTTGAIQQKVRDYLAIGAMSQTEINNVSISINQNVTLTLGTSTAVGSQVTLSYPFSFMVLNPVARLVVSNSTVGAPITLNTSAVMRNEVQF